MAKKRNHICDVPGCGHTRNRFQRLCTACWDKLPHLIRTSLIQAFRSGDRPAWRHWRRRARDHIAGLDRDHIVATARRPGVNPMTLMNRILGERPDA